MQDKGKFADRAEVARHWYSEEYQPVVRMLIPDAPVRSFDIEEHLAQGN